MEQTSILDLRVDDLVEVRMADRKKRLVCWQMGVVVACGKTGKRDGYVKIMIVASNEMKDVGREFVYVRDDQRSGVVRIRARVGKRPPG